MVRRCVCDLETSRIGSPYIYDISSVRVNQLLYYVSLKIYNKFVNYFCELKLSEYIPPKTLVVLEGEIPLETFPHCGVALRRTCRGTELHRVKNANLRHPSAMC